MDRFDVHLRRIVGLRNENERSIPGLRGALAVAEVLPRRLLAPARLNFQRNGR